MGLVFVNRRHSLSGIFSDSDNCSHWLPRRQTADRDEHTLCNVLRTDSFPGFDSLLSYAHPAIVRPFLGRSQFQPQNAHKNEGEEKDAGQACGFMEQHDAYDDSTGGTDARPNGVGCA